MQPAYLNKYLGPEIHRNVPGMHAKAPGIQGLQHGHHGAPVHHAAPAHHGMPINHEKPAQHEIPH